MAENIVKLVIGLIVCAFKFGLGFIPTVQANGYNFVESVLFGMASGLLGSAAFIYAGDYLNRLIDLIGNRIRGNRPRKVRKKFTKTNRRIVAIKSRYGLIGIALVSPILISIPVGAFIAVRYFHNKKKILLYMMGAITLWSIVLSAINLLF